MEQPVFFSRHLYILITVMKEAANEAEDLFLNKHILSVSESRATGKAEELEVAVHFCTV